MQINPVQNKFASTHLIKNKGVIKAVWEKKVRDHVQAAEDQTSIALLNSIEFFLDELAVALDQSTLESSYDASKRGMSKLHGQKRAKFAGYFLPQLLKEFSILREVIIENLHQAEALSFQIVLILNSAFDVATSLAATEFANAQLASVKTALEKAEKSNKELEHFAAIAAHDLKSPLATISGYLDLLAEDNSESLKPETREYIRVMQKTSGRMSSLIDQLLDYARLAERNKPFSDVDLNHVVESVIQNLHDTILKTQAEITYTSLPIVKGDADLLSQVFQNLIANSLKFHGKQPPVIQINSILQDENFLLSVKDNGIGFDKKHSEDIFALYKQLHGSAEHQGVGIGLATCKKVIELHGGRIWADSVPTQGSIFYFTLPRNCPT